MEKDVIFRQRKELKKKGHAVVKSHYIMLIFLMMLLSVFGLEFTFSTLFLGGNPFAGKTEISENNPGSILSADDLISREQVMTSIYSGKIDESAEQSEKLMQDLIKNENGSAALGRTNGVLAQLVNMVGSGRLFSKAAQALRTMIRSDKAVAVIFVLGAFLWYAVIFIFVKNIFSAAVRRIFLEARIYKNVSFLDVLHFAAVRKWARASWIMFVQYFYYTLWSFTIVGGVIKYFSYWAVPYIVAENPSLTAKQAITLSRRMMKGHKFELFKYMLTMFGWLLLAVITLGVTDLLYGAGYRMACYGEFYAKLRETAFEGQLEGIEVLDDRYLFEQADRILLYETYFGVVDEITDLHENRITLTGWRKAVADWLGIWIGSLSKKKAYDEQEGRSFAIQRGKMCMDGTAYPQRLNPRWRKKEAEKHGNFTYLRCYTIWTLILLFITFSFVGWSWEVALHFIQVGEFANRGTLHGPWLPIYGSGGVMVLILCSHFRKKPVAEFFMSILLCGILEYTAAWQLEMKYHTRWWSYDGYFLNLHGRICAEGLLIFGIGCCAVVYLLAPVFDYMVSRIRQKVLIGLCIVLGLAYGTDFVYSRKYPNMAEGAVEELPGTQTGDMTELSSEPDT